jgi:hypothetical protein
MFDAVIFSGPDPERAARTLAGLIEGVIDGLLGRALVVSQWQSADLDKLADASGCRLEQGVETEHLPAVLAAQIKTPHVLAFEAGALLEPGWPVHLNRMFQRHGLPAGDGAIAFRPENFGPRMVLRWIALSAGRLPLTHGLLLPRSCLVTPGVTGQTARVSGKIRMAPMTVARSGGR